MVPGRQSILATVVSWFDFETRILAPGEHEHLVNRELQPRLRFLSLGMRNAGLRRSSPILIAPVPAILRNPHGRQIPVIFYAPLIAAISQISLDAVPARECKFGKFVFSYRDRFLRLSLLVSKPRKIWKVHRETGWARRRAMIFKCERPSGMARRVASHRRGTRGRWSVCARGIARTADDFRDRVLNGRPVIDFR